MRLQMTPQRMRRLTLLTLLALPGLVGCEPVLADHDEIYSRGVDHFVLCAQGIDDTYQIGTDEISDALGRAKADGTTLHLYAHTPHETIATSAIEGVLEAAARHGVELTTYETLGDHEVPGSLALAFDDNSIAQWSALRPLLTRHGARVTFFVSGFPAASADDRAGLRQLADDGHDIQFHSVSHLRADEYVAAHGADAYLAAEIFPGLDAMHAAGYTAGVFAYPHGARSDATDAALAPYFVNLRAIRSTCPDARPTRGDAPR
jgi:hypothetical protein